MINKQKFPKKTITDVPLEGKTVLVRVDYNLPQNDDGSIADDYRIQRSLPTLQYLLKHKCKIVICSHMGRPEGKPNPKYSLEPVAHRLQELVQVPVEFVPEITGDKVNLVTKKLEGGHIIVLENLRFRSAEEANDTAFAQQLAKDTNADYFVQDGFGVVHRAHASTHAITHCLPSVAGFLVKQEFEAIEGAVSSPKRPLVAVLGGAKISDKIKIIERFVSIADHIIIGGAMANTFLKYKGYDIGKSLYEEDLDETMQRIYASAEQKLQGTRSVDDFILLPVDAAVTPSLDDRSLRRYTVSVHDVSPDELIVDVGPATIELATRRLQAAGTVIWNGTMGMAEREQYSYGSARIALQLAQQQQTVSVIGGGDTADFVLGWDSAKGGSFTHVSTGGGASLELMAGDPMPGIDSLLDS